MPQDKPLQYADYLQSDKILGAQQLVKPSWCARRTLHLVAVLLLLFSTPSFAMPASIDAPRIAAYETKMWQAYYDKQFHHLARAAIEMLTVQFQLSTVDALRVSASAAQAARAFAKLPGHTPTATYYHDVLPSLIVMYTQLKQATQSNWDPKQLAVAELKWWMARRYEGKGKPKVVGALIAKLYALLYGQTNANIKKAAYLRAKAANLRDQQHKKGKVNWPQIKALLTQSYQALEKGIKHSP